MTRSPVYKECFLKRSGALDNQMSFRPFVNIQMNFNERKNAAMRKLRPFWFLNPTTKSLKAPEELNQPTTPRRQSSGNKGFKLRPTSGRCIVTKKSKTSASNAKSPSVSVQKSFKFSQANDPAQPPLNFTYGYFTQKPSEKIFQNLTLALTYLDTVSKNSLISSFQSRLFS